MGVARGVIFGYYVIFLAGKQTLTKNSQYAVLLSKNCS